MKIEQEAWRQALVAYQPGDGLLRTPAWSAGEFSVRLDNISDQARSLTSWLLFDGQVATADAAIYGEGFQMLAQSGGTWGAPQAIGRCPDAAVYRITPDEGYHTVHNLLMYQLGARWYLLGFTSCQRFGGEFRLYPDGRLQILLNSEGLLLGAGKHWQSESLLVLCGSNREALLQEYATRIQHHHPALAAQPRATGWCSWYHYYAEVTRQDIVENLQQMSSKFPRFQFVQIDDGYQKAMGDWLLPAEHFSGGLSSLVATIHDAGFEPALWVAPFIAEPGSQLFRDHPEWFVKNAQGEPMPAESVTYGGWRCTPWYVLDGTHPGVQAHLRQLFHTLRQEYGIRYFKLDANFWGAIHGGRFSHPDATRIQAYRQGMAAIFEGAGADSFLLGCNAPFWPSLGLVHGMRVADDVERSGHRIRQIAREIFCRSWQADQLWQLDPDCLCLRNIPGQEASAAEYSFHAAATVASGGMLLLGDRLSVLDEDQLRVINKLYELAAAKIPAAHFVDDRFEEGIIPWNGGRLHCFFNWQAESRLISLPAESCDFWSSTPLAAGQHTLPGYAGLVIWSPHS
ncbi:MAG: glycoside hydrolase family 36 protein [Aeromonadaceae bacterium]